MKAEENYGKEVSGRKKKTYDSTNRVYGPISSISVSFIGLRIRGEGGVDGMEEDGEEKMEA